MTLRKTAPPEMSAASVQRTMAAYAQNGIGTLRTRPILPVKSAITQRQFQRESRRKERLDHTVDQLRRQHTAARVRISVQPDVFNQKLANLSSGVILEAGHLHIAFASTEDLLRKLFELSQAASNDFDRFRAAAEPAERRSA